MIAYILRGEWKGVLDPDNRGNQEEVFLAYSDEHARKRAREIAQTERFRPTKLVRITGDGLEKKIEL